MDSLERKGYWWLPEEPEIKLAGILHFDGIKSPALELFGAFRKSDELRTDVIWGETAEAERVTLCDCKQPFLIHPQVLTFQRKNTQLSQFHSFF